jgi:hypothetical protein
VAAVIANSAKPANAINVIRDVKILDLREREFDFVFIIVNLLLSPVLPVGLTHQPPD